MLLKLAFKSVLSRRSSLIIILFITFAVCLFCVANAVFDSTEQGVQTNYASSFTGDFIIRPYTKKQQSLFGDETPVTGSLTVLEPLIPYSDIEEKVLSLPEVESYVPQVTGALAVERSDGSNRTAGYIFGVEAEDYLPVMKSIHIKKGSPYKKGERGALLCSQVAQRLGVDVGDTIQFIAADGPNFRIRAVTVNAIFEYEIYNDIFSRFMLVDPQTVRSVMGMTEAFNADYEIAEEYTNLFDDSSDFDDIFDDVQDIEPVITSEDENNYEDSAADNSLQETEAASSQESTTWNYIIVRLKPGTNAGKLIKKLNHYCRQKEWPVEAADWRHAAGSTALYLYWMRMIFNIGIIIILSAGFIIVNNSLVINILDRTREIGTLRAIGAKKRFISLQCMIENFILTITSGVFGILLGEVCVFFINKANIVLSNSFLIQLFGSSALKVYINGSNILKLFILVIVLGLLGWIYPVMNALKVSPVNAIQGAK